MYRGGGRREGGEGSVGFQTSLRLSRKSLSQVASSWWETGHAAVRVCQEKTLINEFLESSVSLAIGVRQCFYIFANTRGKCLVCVLEVRLRPGGTASHDR